MHMTVNEIIKALEAVVEVSPESGDYPVVVTDFFNGLPREDIKRPGGAGLLLLPIERVYAPGILLSLGDQPLLFLGSGAPLFT